MSPVLVSQVLHLEWTLPVTRTYYERRGPEMFMFGTQKGKYVEREGVCVEMWSDSEWSIFKCTSQIDPLYGIGKYVLHLLTLNNTELTADI
jgi:hypothetical protein